MVKAVSGVTLAALLATSASVATAADNAGKKTGAPDEVICEKVQVPGSRLVAKKVCMTRAQWAERKLQERGDLDRAQTQKGYTGSN